MPSSLTAFQAEEFLCCSPNPGEMNNKAIKASAAECLLLVLGLAGKLPCLVIYIRHTLESLLEPR